MIDSNWISAFLTLIVNLGSGFVINDIKLSFTDIFDLALVKVLVLFSIIYMNTKDIYISAISSLTVVLIYGLLSKKKILSKVNE